MKLPGWVSNLAPLARKRQASRDASGRLLEQAREERAAGDLRAAEQHYGEAIAADPGRAESHYELGALLQASGRTDAALEYFLEALRLKPDYFDAAYGLAFGWSANGDADQAEHFSRLALDINPASPVLHLLLGVLLFDSGRHEEAVQHNLEAVALEPQSAQARNNLANSLKQVGKTSEALAQYRKAVELEPRLAEGHFNLGAALLEMRELEAAERHLRLAVEANPDFAEATFGLAHLLGEKGEARAAVARYRRVIALQPQSAQAHFNLALQLLLVGDYEEGWREYEWRLRLPDVANLWPRFSCPVWPGSNRPGESVLLYAEQGYGDAIQMIRFAPFVAATGARVLVRCRRELKALFERVPQVSSVSGFDEALPESDYVCPLLSLPSIFSTGLASLPAGVPYLHPPGEQVRLWKDRMSNSPQGLLKVGLAWSSDPHNKAASVKSLPWAVIEPLWKLPRVAFYSLQKGVPAGGRVAPAAPFVDWTSELHDFADTAALIANLDLVISIDTAVAHLAGALAKPVWTLASFPPDWRWLLDRPDSPWYPTMRLFRQGHGEDWGKVVADVAAALSSFRPSAG